MSKVPSRTTTVRAYIALCPQALRDETWEGALVRVVDEDWCAAAGFPNPCELHGEEREVAEDEVLHAAALNSLDAQIDTPHPLRLVAVAEVADTDLKPSRQESAGEYVLTRPIQYSEVVSYHVDEPAAGAEVATIAQLRAGQEAHKAETGESLQELELPELLWFDGSELEVLREFLGLS